MIIAKTFSLLKLKIRHDIGGFRCLTDLINVLDDESLEQLGCNQNTFDPRGKSGFVTAATQKRSFKMRL